MMTGFPFVRRIVVSTQAHLLLVMNVDWKTRIIYLVSQVRNTHFIKEKYGHVEEWFRKTVGFEYEGLTESEANYLLRSKSAERIRNQITRAIHENNGG